jgi:hypothetical protein
MVAALEILQSESSQIDMQILFQFNQYRLNQIAIHQLRSGLESQYIFGQAV